MKHEALREEVKRLGDELAAFLDQADPRSATFRVAAERVLQDAAMRLSGMHSRSS